MINMFIFYFHYHSKYGSGFLPPKHYYNSAITWKGVKDMAIVNTLSNNNLVNALVNNTFYVDKFENAIRNAMYNSFNYLEEIQEAFINIHRFNLNEDDLYTDRDGNICFSINKDFIDGSKRKMYKHSQFYNKWLTLREIIDNQTIFSWFPVILIDGKSVFSYTVKASLDGNTIIRLDYVKLKKTFLSLTHDIQVFYLMDTNYTKFETTLSEIESYNWVLPTSVTGFDYQKEKLAFMYLRDKSYDNGSNIFLVDIGENGEVILDSQNDSLYDILYNANRVEMVILGAENFYNIENNLVVQRRHDNDRLSAITVLQPEEDLDYPMPIPTQNLILLKVDKNTGESIIQNNRDVKLHYPNIYEIMSDDFEDTETYEYKAAYFYNKADIAFSYISSMAPIYKFYKKKLNVDTLQEAVEKLLYSEFADPDVTQIQNFFFNKFEQDQPTYVYDMESYRQSEVYKHDFDYKLDKFKEFGGYDFHILEDYGKDVTNPFFSYILYTKNIDLESRKRRDTRTETSDIHQQVDFSEEMYLFMFEERDYNESALRFFINGLLCNEYYLLHQGRWSYIYIPTRLIDENSYIYIEKFYTYYKMQKITFENTTDFIDLVFEEDSLIQPTLYDLFVTDRRFNRIDRKRFKIYALIEKGEYDVSDDVGDPSHDIIDIVLQDDHHPAYEDPETGDLYVEIGEHFDDEIYVTLLDPVSDAEDPYLRVKCRYLSLRKLKIKAKDTLILNEPLYFIVNKSPRIIHKDFEIGTAVPTVPILRGGVIWKQDTAYIRVFMNGRFMPSILYMYTDPETLISYLTPNFYVNDGTTLSVDISSYSYDKMYRLYTIPANGIVDLANKISRPFNLYYYDVYLNGKRILQPNIQILSPNKIKLLNVNSVHNLVIIQKDRDEDFLQLVNSSLTPVDEFLDNSNISYPDKKLLIDIIVKEDHGDDFIYNTEDIEDTEEDYYEYDYSEETTQEILFYTEQILPLGVARPNEVVFDEDKLKKRYPLIHNVYADLEKERLVLRPNIQYDAKHVAMLGRNTDFVHDTTPWSEESEEELEFFNNVIQTRSVMRPNVESFPETEIRTEYPRLVDAYATDDSLIIHPNRDHNTKYKAMIGRDMSLVV